MLMRWSNAFVCVSQLSGIVYTLRSFDQRSRNDGDEFGE